MLCKFLNVCCLIIQKYYHVIISFSHWFLRTAFVLTIDSLPANPPCFRIMLYLVLSYELILFSLLGCYSSCCSGPCHQQPECQHYWIFAHSLYLPASQESFLYQAQSVNKSIYNLIVIFQTTTQVNVFFFPNSSVYRLLLWVLCMKYV